MANPRLCSVVDCGKPHDSHGYCGAHAQRFKRHGDPLGGGTSHHEPRTHFLEVVLPYDGAECLIWPYARDMQGYAKLHVGRKNKLVSRLVCEHAYGPPPEPTHEAAHSCGNGMSGCVSKRHLSWKSRIDNEKDKLEHGTHQFGERNPVAKLTEDNVRQIRALKGEMHQHEIAKNFGVSQTLISHIHNRISWGWLPD